jgi:hypothetical protein
MRCADRIVWPPAYVLLERQPARRIVKIPHRRRSQWWQNLRTARGKITIKAFHRTNHLFITDFAKNQHLSRRFPGYSRHQPANGITGEHSNRIDVRRTSPVALATFRFTDLHPGFPQKSLSAFATFGQLPRQHRVGPLYRFHRRNSPCIAGDRKWDRLLNRGLDAWHDALCASC